MSAKIMGLVWDLKLSPAERIVLLAMADHADHDGNNVRPSIGLIAWKTDYSERQVKRIIKDLRDAGLLVVTKGATPTTPYHYRINIAAGVPKEPYNSAKRGDILTPPARGDILTPGDIAMSLGGDTGDTPRGDIAMSPEPSSKPSVNRESGEREKSPARTPVVAAYFEHFSSNLTAAQVQAINTTVRDVTRWRKVLEEWALNGWSPKAIAKMLDRYSSGLTAADERPGGARANGTPPDRPTPRYDLPVVSERKELPAAERRVLLERARAKQAEQ